VIDTREAYEHPVAFFLNGIGDNILVLPALRALAAMFPGKLTLVCGPPEETEPFGELALRRVVRTRVRRTPHGPRFDHYGVARRIGSCDLFISLVPWRGLDMPQLLRRLAPRRSIGYSWAFDVEIPCDFDKHYSLIAFDAVRALSPAARFANFAAPPRFSRHSLNTVRNITGAVPTGMKTMTVHCDSTPEKMWPFDRFMNVLEAVLTSHPACLAFLVGAPAFAAQVAGALRHAHGRVIPACALTLPAAQCLVAMSDAFLGIDSCHLHVADFSRVPSVGLFGPSRSEIYGFIAGPHITLQANGDIRAIDEDHVVRSVEALFSRDERRLGTTIRLPDARPSTSDRVAPVLAPCDGGLH
jgi:hypothetical protein